MPRAVRSLRVLVSGAGVAGATLAALLSRHGHQVTLVERDDAPRSSGNPVDVRGRAMEVIEDLGLSEPLRDLATRVRELVVVDAAGTPVARMPTQRRDGDVEVARADLCALLLTSAQQDVEVRFGDTLTSVRAGDEGAEVTFERAAPEHVDLVVGADGLHSTVRRLAFGPEEDFVHHLGLYVATVRLPDVLERDDAVVLYNEPGTAIALHPGARSPGAAFLLRSSARCEPHDRGAAHELLERAYGHGGWRSRELLDRYLCADDTYFDTVSRVKVANWVRGPVVLLGDAASCVTLFGEGSSAAITGAATLARSLALHPLDPDTAVRRHQLQHRAATTRGQRAAPLSSRVLIPASRPGISLRNRVLRLASATGRHW